MMKYIMTFEKYQTYSDYKQGGMRWGSPEDLKDDAILTLKRLLPTFDEKWIDSVEDMSDDKKGIKFEIKVGKDIIHMFKTGNYRGSWEYYLNKKKSSESKVQDHLEAANMSQVEKFLKHVAGYDFWADYIDNGGQRNDAVSNNKSIEDIFNSLSKSDKKEAVKGMQKMFKHSEFEKVFKA